MPALVVPPNFLPMPPMLQALQALQALQKKLLLTRAAAARQPAQQARALWHLADLVRCLESPPKSHLAAHSAG